MNLNLINGLNKNAYSTIVLQLTMMRPRARNAQMGVIFMNNKTLDVIALTIAIIGAINWGLIGFFNFDAVSFLFGSLSWISRIIYVLVGISGIYLITFYMYAGGREHRLDRI